MKESMSLVSGHINNRCGDQGGNCRVAVNKLGSDPDILSPISHTSYLLFFSIFIFLKHKICHLFLELFNNPIITSWLEHSSRVPCSRVSLIPFHYRETQHIGYGYICPSPWLQYGKKQPTNITIFCHFLPAEQVDLQSFIFISDFIIFMKKNPCDPVS